MSGCTTKSPMSLTLSVRPAEPEPLPGPVTMPVADTFIQMNGIVADTP